MIENYYNNLAPYYKFIYSNWDASVKRQAKILDEVIREFAGGKAATILDAACGIGTQSIGLAQLGYNVAASDLSSSEVEQASREASRQGLKIEFQVADMRQVWDRFQRQFDVVIACDNAVPHLLNEDEILLAFRQFYQCLKPDGCCLISVRDYAQLERGEKQKQMYPRTVHKTGDGQIVIFDVWDFEGDCYEITTYIVNDTGGEEARTHTVRGGKYYCIEIPALERLLHAAGFREVTTLRERFFQPLLVAQK